MNKDILRKLILAGSLKAIDLDKKVVTAYASTKDWDRYGERFEPDAFKDGLDNYKKNPVVLFAHDYASPPIGKSIGFAFDTMGLITDTQFADTPMAKDIFELYAGGFMNAFSVGFKPTEIRYEERIAGSGEMGAVFVKAELFENSAVPVPANPGALVKRGLMGAAQRVLAPTIALPAEWTAFEKSIAQEGQAPDLTTSLEYVVGLAKILKHKGKVSSETLRSLLIQANNVFRELIYGVGTQSLDPAAGEMTEGEIGALVKEYELLAQTMHEKGASIEDMNELAKLAELLQKAISGN